MYQQIDKATHARIGEPGPLPLAIAGWAPPATYDLEATDESFGLRGTEFWPVVPSEPAYDPATQRLGALVPGDIDVATRTVPATYAVEALPPPLPPDNPTLSDWRVAMTLWGRIDDLTARVNALVSSSDPAKALMGKIAKERLERANNVLRAQLVQLGPVFGFSAADIDESLWRADRVRQGDLSGAWPLPAAP